MTDDTKTLATDAQALQKALKQPDATDAELTTACNAIIKKVDGRSDAGRSDRKPAVACGTFTTDAATVKTDQAAVAWTKTGRSGAPNVSDGQLLFELNCARCHTEGWSTFDSAVPPDQPGGVDVLGLPGGGGGTGGGIGFNLRDSDVIRRFGTDASAASRPRSTS